MVRCHGFDTPKIHGVAHAHVERVASPATQSHAAQHAVNEATDAPCGIEVEPACAAAQTGERAENGIWSCADDALAALENDTFFRGENDGSCIPLAAEQGVCPRGFDVARVEIGEGEANGGGVVEGIDLREDLLCGVVGYDDVVTQALDEGTSDSRGDWCDQVHPVRREPGGEYRYGYEAPFQPARAGVTAQHVAIGQNVCSADFDDAPGTGGCVECGHEIIQQIFDSERLSTRVQPARAYHQWQPLGQVTDDFKREAA
jgi:hypothetical protein